MLVVSGIHEALGGYQMSGACEAKGEVETSSNPDEEGAFLPLATYRSASIQGACIIRMGCETEMLCSQKFENRVYFFP
jgi:hypothetical protein